MAGPGRRPDGLSGCSTDEDADALAEFAAGEFGASLRRLTSPGTGPLAVPGEVRAPHPASRPVCERGPPGAGSWAGGALSYGRTMPGMTTNVEFGLDVATGRAVLGCPPPAVPTPSATVT
ncbi:hypothetical protein GCM10010347_65620 [Streptomyces cirratus]|uniref:Uncharacterized protein n=1 Tax=Streptomyces cirratus TaxID=68187 RepID=A0ABQ3F5J5_9ACTN|nr:hypothetical protein GCM10010347_65620 [Streptomyces cirratus]